MIFNQIKTVFFLGLLAGLFMAVGFALGSTTGLIIGFVLAMLINFGSYWFSDKIVLKMHKAREVHKGHKLYDIVEELAKKAKMVMPKVYIIQAPSPNAFATGRSPKHSAVAATESLLQLLTEDEVRGVMAHELSHVKHRDTLIQTIAVAIASAIAFTANIMQWAIIFGTGRDSDSGIGGIVGPLVIIILTPIIATVIQLAISRQREYLADAGAAKIMGTGKPLITALEKLEAMAGRRPSTNSTAAPQESLYIVNPFKKTKLLSLFSTHPSTDDRIKRLNEIKL